jgi:Uma2 family endonuclease
MRAMATVLNTPEQKVILNGVSWETYARLLNEHQEKPGTRFNYDRGTLEIMVVSFEHEKMNHLLALLAELFANERDIDLVGGGSTTFSRKDLERAFEPDSCFYIQHAKTVRAKKEIDLNQDPPPDLVIEIDLTSPSLNKLPIYAAIGVPEVWRYSKAVLQILKLENNAYVVSSDSSVLPKITAADLNHLLKSGQQLEGPAWHRQVREWAKSL